MFLHKVSMWCQSDRVRNSIGAVLGASSSILFTYYLGVQNRWALLIALLCSVLGAVIGWWHREIGQVFVRVWRKISLLGTVLIKDLLPAVRQHKFSNQRIAEFIHAHVLLAFCLFGMAIGWFFRDTDLFYMFLILVFGFSLHMSRLEIFWRHEEIEENGIKINRETQFNRSLAIRYSNLGWFAFTKQMVLSMGLFYIFASLFSGIGGVLTIAIGTVGGVAALIACLASLFWFMVIEAVRLLVRPNHWICAGGTFIITAGSIILWYPAENRTVWSVYMQALATGATAAGVVEAIRWGVEKIMNEIPAIPLKRNAVNILDGMFSLLDWSIARYSSICAPLYKIKKLCPVPEIIR